MLLVSLSLLIGCGGEAPPPAPAPEPVVAPAPEPPKHAAIFGALPEVMADDPATVTDAKVELGRMLYYDTRLSKNQDLSCNSCHQLDKYGVDNQPTSPGHKGQLGGRNSPTSYNAALHLAQFWDGRAPTVEEQAKGPVLNPVEMAMKDEASVVAVLKSIPGYEAKFAAAFGDGEITYQRMADAIGAFERKLVTPGRFDTYVKGDASALTAEEQAGLDLFVSTGCVSCHMGVGLGGSTYQKLGAVKPYETKDAGRMDVTKNEADKHFFKVPSLRNIAKTGPYFHDGSVATLEDAVKLMADHQLGKTLSDADVASIVTFLNALTGEIPADYVKAPALPESGPNTPKPDPS